MSMEIEKLQDENLKLRRTIDELTEIKKHARSGKSK